VEVKVGVGKVGVIVLVKVGLTRAVDVEAGAGGGFVGVGANNVSIEHPERKRHASKIKRSTFIIHRPVEWLIDSPIVVLKALFESPTIARKVDKVIREVSRASIGLPGLSPAYQLQPNQIVPTLFLV
jgi:hypothetical protein